MRQLIFGSRHNILPDSSPNMKFAATTLLLAAAIGAAKAADTQRLNGRAVSALRKVSRRLDEEDNQEEGSPPAGLLLLSSFFQVSSSPRDRRW